jgi:UDP-N-acetylmuramate--alanine ligase
VVAVEVDESDATHPELPLFGTILLNVEVDHLDFFGTEDAMVASFDQYLSDFRAEGSCRRPRLRRARCLPRCDHVRTSEGRLSGHRHPLGSRVELLHRDPSRYDARYRRSSLRGPWSRNARVRWLWHAVGIEFGVAAPPLFGGVARRFDIRGVDGGATLVDDYAHLPSEISAVLSAARSSGDGWRRLVAVFQPNRFNRMAILSPAYRDAFVGADLVVLTDIYASGTAPIPGVTGKLVVNGARRHPATHWRGCHGEATDRLPRKGTARRRRVHLDGVATRCVAADELMQRRAELRATAG